MTLILLASETNTDGWFGSIVSYPLGYFISQFQEDPNFAHTLASGIIVTAILVLLYFVITHYMPYSAAISARLTALSGSLARATSTDTARSAFFENFHIIDAVMLKPSKGQTSLPHTWTEFKETWVDQDQAPIKSTTRAIDHFGTLPLGTAWLNFWANTFVGLGLLLTFIGIIAGLEAATDAIKSAASASSSGASSNDMDAALQQLLAASTAKFYTSIAGLFAAILIRVIDRVLLSRLQSAISRLCELIESGLAYTPVQSISVSQLRELREQSKTLKTFSTDLAVSIGDKFQNAMAPLVTATNNVSNSLSGLATLGDTLNSVGTAVQGGGQEAANQIKQAAQAFSAAALDVNKSLGGIVAQISTMSEQMTQKQSQANDQMFAKLQSALAALDNSTAAHTQRLEGSIAGIALAGERATERLTQSVTRAARAAGQAAAEQFKEASRDIAAQIQASATELRSNIGQSVSLIQALNQSISQQLSQFQETAQNASALNKELLTSTQSFQAISRPFVESSQKLSAASERLERASQQIVTSTETASTALTQAATTSAAAGKQFSDTQRNLETIWRQYSDRFAEIDKSVAQAVRAIVEQFANSLEQLVKHSGKIDADFASATTKLSNVVSQLNDFAEEIGEIAKRLERASGR